MYIYISIYYIYNMMLHDIPEVNEAYNPRKKTLGGTDAPGPCDSHDRSHLAASVPCRGVSRVARDARDTHLRHGKVYSTGKYSKHFQAAYVTPNPNENMIETNEILKTQLHQPLMRLMFPFERIHNQKKQRPGLAQGTQAPVELELHEEPELNEMEVLR
jgi:hypothetical protein